MATTDTAATDRRRLTLVQRLGTLRGWVRSRAVLSAALIFSLLAAFYWLFWASDRFVAESRVIVERTDLTAQPAGDLGSLIGGSTAGNRSDQLLMREYLLSRDVVAALDEQLKLQAHYTSPAIDYFSRLRNPDGIEDLHAYYLERVDITYDDYAGVLVIEPQAFSAEMSQALGQALIAQGEAFMNRTANQLAGGQIEFLEEQVDELQSRVFEERQQVLAFQNRNRIASPEQQAASIGNVIAGLETRKSELEVELASQSSFLVDDHPVLVEIRRQIAAINRQIGEQNSRLAGAGDGSLNTTAEQLARLEADAQFAEQLLASALTSLEQARVESIRSAKSLSVIQQPGLPDEAVMPNRWLKTATFFVFAFLLAGIAQLLLMIVRDHRDS